MKSKKHIIQSAELTPLEKIETLYQELLDWYGDADKKEQRIAAKLLLVSLNKFAESEGNGWHSLVMEYVDILQKDPEKFQRILLSNRGELRDKKDSTPIH